MASSSRSGEFFAVLNSPPKIIPYRFDIVVIDKNHNILRRIQPNTQSFSRPVVVGSNVIANQLFADHYEVTLVDIKTGKAEKITELINTPAALQALEMINLTYK